MTTKNLKWRLGKLPTPSEVAELVKDKIITAEEAKNILFSTEEESERDKASLESEIKFLREIIDKLSSDRPRTIEIIREVEKPYTRHHWINPYKIWCDGSSNLAYANNTMYSSTGDDSAQKLLQAFADIKNF